MRTLGTRFGSRSPSGESARLRAPATILRGTGVSFSRQAGRRSWRSSSQRRAAGVWESILPSWSRVSTPGTSGTSGPPCAVVARKRRAARKQPYRAGSEVGGTDPAAEVHHAPKTPALGEDAAHLVGEAHGL